ncbi:ArsR/SmtB family transcription factor [Kitasatospora sp. NPDC085464]|uniref:ArsR/SmtB family transcription factor n=1 Tax=Kitasatospora sp. NPDC085464 TaxID=3364063 RepID=UPI0037C87B49
MIRIDLGSQGLGKVRFAMTPLDVAKDLLYSLARSPGSLDPEWQATARQALSAGRLGLLAVVAGGGPRGYAPDFLRPEPPGFQLPLDEALHRVATTSRDRIRYELTGAVGGHSWGRTAADRPPRLLLDAMERGEEYVAQRIAVELEQFWHTALARHWPGIRARLEGDVAARATVITRHGIAEAVNHLAPNLEWDGGALTVHPTAPGLPTSNLDADAAIFVPSVFAGRATFCGAEPPGAPAPRLPLIVYPVGPNDCLPTAPDGALIGPTRTRLMAELAQPRTTGELARRVHLSPATVSYHLQILHRAGLVQRTRRSRTVLYQRALATHGGQ